MSSICNRSTGISLSAVVGLAVFIVGDYIVGGNVDPLGLDAAKAACEAKGWQDWPRSKARWTVSGWPLWHIASVELKTVNRRPPKTVHVTLRRSFTLFGWQLVDFKEE
jgi:hypothetical protein